MVQVLDQGIHSAGVPYSYGFAIILLTILVKLATYPLSKQQVLFPPRKDNTILSGLLCRSA